METQITHETKMQPEAVPGVGEWQSKLAELLKRNLLLTEQAYLFATKRRDVSAKPLLSGCRAIYALSENCQLLVTHFKDHETRESFAQDLYEKLTK